MYFFWCLTFFESEHNLTGYKVQCMKLYIELTQESTIYPIPENCLDWKSILCKIKLYKTAIILKKLILNVLEQNHLSQNKLYRLYILQIILCWTGKAWIMFHVLLSNWTGFLSWYVQILTNNQLWCSNFQTLFNISLFVIIVYILLLLLSWAYTKFLRDFFWKQKPSVVQ